MKGSMLGIFILIILWHSYVSITCNANLMLREKRDQEAAIDQQTTLESARNMAGKYAFYSRVNGLTCRHLVAVNILMDLTLIVVGFIGWRSFKRTSSCNKTSQDASPPAATGNQ